MGLMDDVTQRLSEMVADTLSTESRQRISALLSAKVVMPEADVYDRIRLSRYILTEREDMPEFVQNMAGETVAEPDPASRPVTYPFLSGDVMMLGPGIFASTFGPKDETVINWAGRNFTPQQNFAAVTEPPDLSAAEPAPTSGAGWSGRRG